ALTLAPQISAEAHERLLLENRLRPDVAAEYERAQYALMMAHRYNEWQTDIYTLRIPDSLRPTVEKQPDVIHRGALDVILSSSPEPTILHRDYLPAIKT